MTRSDALLTDVDASVILRRGGVVRFNFRNHCDLDKLRAEGWSVEVIEDDGRLAMVELVKAAQQSTKAN